MSVPWWKRRLIAIVLTVDRVVSAGRRVVSDHCLALAAELDGLDNVAAVAATAVQWLEVVVVALLASFAIAYYFGTQKWEWIRQARPSGVLDDLVNLGFRAYLHYGTDFGATYGILAGVVLLLLCRSALALLVGARSTASSHAALQQFSGQNAWWSDHERDGEP